MSDKRQPKVYRILVSIPWRNYRFNSCPVVNNYYGRKRTGFGLEMIVSKLFSPSSVTRKNGGGDTRSFHDKPDNNYRAFFVYNYCSIVTVNPRANMSVALQVSKVKVVPRDFPLDAKSPRNEPVALFIPLI